jgi:hypothetical protein
MNWKNFAVKAACGWFMMLVVLHYFNQRPLWLDEACVFESIKQYKPAELFQLTLLKTQAFPRLHLWIIQRLTDIFGSSVLVLRFMSFAAMTTAFWLWMIWAKRQWADERFQLTFALCWASSIPLIYYGAELKPYSMDVLASVLLLWALDKQSKAVVWFPLMGLVSYPALFLSFIPLYNLALSGWRKGKWQRMFQYLAVLAGVVAFVYLFDLRHSNKSLLESYWHEYFISFGSPSKFFKTFGEGINNLISRWFAETPKWVRGASRLFMGAGLLYIVINFGKQFKAQRFLFASGLTLAAGIFVELMLLGALRQYPFSVPRMSLFFAPFLLAAAVQFIVWLKTQNIQIYRLYHTVFIIYLVYISLGAFYVITSGHLGAQSILWVRD